MDAKDVKKLFNKEIRLLKQRIDYLERESKSYIERERNLMSAYGVLSDQLKFSHLENEKLKKDYREAMFKLGFTVSK